jgi:hypothetical protein
MSVKNFKFVSPGVFIHEIDNSFIPKSAQNIGPLVIGRAQHGLAMTPVKVESYSQFVEMFGDTVPGMGGGSPTSGDVYRYGNYQSPMYGTYAAKAFLKANVAPLTYMRLLGVEDGAATNDGAAGWQNASQVSSSGAGGGSYGLWVFASSSVDGGTAASLTGTLAAIIYANTEASVPMLSGAYWAKNDLNQSTASVGALVNTDSDGLYTLQVGTTGKKIKFNLDDSSENFLRKKLNTNPQLMSAGDFYATTGEVDYWLGQSYEQSVRDAGLNTGNNSALLCAIALSGTQGGFDPSTSITPGNMKKQSAEAASGWFIGQDLGPSGSYNPASMQKLFRLKGRGHGEWLHRNVKVSISNIRQSNTTISDYGTFSVILRSLHDTDTAMQIVERYDNLTLDPTSPDFVARRIGDKYQSWDATKKLLREYGEYPNLSKYVHVEMNSDVEAGASDALLLPFGYQGPAKFTDVGMRGDAVSSASAGGWNDRAVVVSSEYLNYSTTGSNQTMSCPMTGAAGSGIIATATISLKFPHVRLRISASEGGLTDPTNAYFGLQTTRETGSTKADQSVGDYGAALYGAVAGSDLSAATTTGVDAFAYIFSLDDVATSGSGENTQYYWASGSRVRGDVPATWKTLLDANYNRFTAPLVGGLDGFDIMKPDPLYNQSMTAASNERNSSIYATWRRAIDTVADPEYVDMNVLVAPGLTTNALTTHMINVCSDRADCLALIDLANVYVPPHEKYYSSKASRLVDDSLSAANNLKDRRIDSSYGATFYPWVQTRDENTGILVWIPPSVAMLGVFGSSHAKSHVWFAPAGFNRGGLTEGAAGIPITSVIRRLTSKNRDTLYENRINPIASFPSTGIVVFGQKTLQQRQSALDRINVRRLVIFLKKQISILAAQILFEQNVEATWTRFKTLIEPFLANVKTQFGITDYRLILDESTTTPDLIDQNILYAKIMVKPARAIEFIAIDFVITSTGASFDD